MWRVHTGACLALAILVATTSAGCAQVTDAKEQVTPQRAVWIWGKNVREEGAEQVAARLEAAGIDTALVLVKGVSGTTSFESEVALSRAPGGDVLEELLAACRPRGIGVHAWVIFHGDAEWVKAHPEDAMHSCGDGKANDGGTRPSDERVCPAAPEYRAYLAKLIRELLERHPVDGVHLDCIRYPTLGSCFCPRHREKAAAAGIDFDKVRQVAMKTLTDPAAKEHFIDLYRQGDSDIRRWVDLRREEIDSFVREVAQIVAETRPEAELSAALMPEGAARDDTFALCHYAQDYRTFGQICDFLCPMSYHASYAQPATWPADIAELAAERSGKPVLAGVQAFDPSTPADLAEALKELERRHLPGFVLFSYAAMTEERWGRVRE